MRINFLGLALVLIGGALMVMGIRGTQQNVFALLFPKLLAPTQEGPPPPVAKPIPALPVKGTV